MFEELELVRAFRADVPEPEEATIASARAALVAVIADERRSPRREPHQRAKLRRIQRRRRFVLAGGLALIGVVLAGTLGFSNASAPQSALAAEMNQLARIAASRAWTGIPGPGQYLFTESEGPNTNDVVDLTARPACYIRQIQLNETWTTGTGSGFLYQSNEGGRFTSAADRANCAAWHINDPAHFDNAGSDALDSGSLFPTTVRGWQALSTDPATLLRQIHRLDGGPNDPGELFWNIGDAMRASPPPAISAALYRAAELIPGVKVLGQKTDPLGRMGLAIEYPYPDGKPHQVQIFNQTTAELLAQVYYAPDGARGDWSAFQPAKIVDQLPADVRHQATTSTPSSSSADSSPGRSWASTAFSAEIATSS